MCFEDERWEMDCRADEQMADEILELIQDVQTRHKLTQKEFNRSPRPKEKDECLVS